MERPKEIPQPIWDECRYAWLDQEDIAPSAVGYDGWRAIEFAARRLTLSRLGGSDMDWMPIETAPKDGAPIDIGGRDWEGKWERWCNAYWSDDWGGWRGLWSDGFESSIPDDRFKPTHWMPLPTPPPEGKE